MDYGGNISPIPSPDPFKEQSEEEEEEEAEAKATLTQKDPLTSTPKETTESSDKENSWGPNSSSFEVSSPPSLPCTGGSQAFKPAPASSTFNFGFLRPPLKVCQPTPFLLQPDCIHFFESLVEFANVQISLQTGEVTLTRSPARYG